MCHAECSKNTNIITKCRSPLLAVYCLILNNIYTPKVIHLTPKDLVSKYELLSMFSSSFKREDIVINPTNADLVIDRTLLSDTSIDNQAIWNIAGYDGVPTISELVKELSISVYTKTILEGL